MKNFLKKIFPCLFPKTISEIKIFPHYTPDELDFEIIDLINKYRESYGLTILQDCDLAKNSLFDVSNSHSEWLAENIVDLDDYNTRKHFYLEERQNAFIGKRVGEMSAMGYKTAKSVVAAWKNSEFHNEMMTSEKYRKIGVSHKLSNSGKMFYCVMFTD